MMTYNDAEQRLFDHVRAQMQPYSHLTDAEEIRHLLYQHIHQACKEHNLWRHITQPKIDRKAKQWAKYWTKSKASFTPAQQEKGRQTQQRRARADRSACHLLRKQGKSLREIARHLQISKSKVGYLLKSYPHG